MATTLGLVGLPNAGKSTLFNALTTANAAVAPYPFTTTDPNRGVAAVDDPRLAQLAGCLHPEQLLPATLEVVDIAGLVKGAHQGEGLGNQFLSHIFSVDALVHVVRCFEDPNVAHTLGRVDPLRDVEVITTELMLKDLEVLSRRKEKEQKLAKGGDTRAIQLLARLEAWQRALSDGIPLRRLAPAPEAHPRAHGIELLTAKPVVYVANIAEPSAQTQELSALGSLRTLAAEEGAPLVVCCAQLEAEVAQLEPSEQAAMRAALGLGESALPQVIRSGYALLHLVTFFTTTSHIVQAWPVSQGTTAPAAAGIIHTDFERRFIRAEVISVDEFVRCGSEATARAQGRLRVEGKGYVVQDGDVMHFRIGS